jgi:hypothetical protein
MDNMETSPLNLSKTALLVFNAMFSDEKVIVLNGKDYKIFLLPKKNLRTVTIEGYQFMKQNTQKDSKWAKMAQEGHKIMWVFKNRKYFARVIDGELTLL